MTPVRIDARGMRCPWPVIRLGRAMREHGGTVLIIADDPAAPREIAALAMERGWRLQPADEPMAWFVDEGPAMGGTEALPHSGEP